MLLLIPLHFLSNHGLVLADILPASDTLEAQFHLLLDTTRQHHIQTQNTLTSTGLHYRAGRQD